MIANITLQKKVENYFENDGVQDNEDGAWNVERSD